MHIDASLNEELDKARKVHHEGGMPQKHDVIDCLDKAEEFLLAQVETIVSVELLDFSVLDHSFLDRLNGALAFVERAEGRILFKQVLEYGFVLEHQHAHGVSLPLFLLHFEIHK